MYLRFIKDGIKLHDCKIERFLKCKSIVFRQTLNKFRIFVFNELEIFLLFSTSIFSCLRILQQISIDLYVGIITLLLFTFYSNR